MYAILLFAGSPAVQSIALDALKIKYYLKYVFLYSQ